jgi:hypothetical protein
VAKATKPQPLPRTTTPAAAGRPGAAKSSAPLPYEPPKLLKFDRLEKLIVSGE